MKKSKLTRMQTLLLVIGLLMNTATQIVMHYYSLPDAVSGILLGAGIGVMLSALLWRKRNPARNMS